jgi:ribosomal protein S18 acetylase RimI-like enzyme
MMIAADEIRHLDQIGLRALPALETVHYDGWLLRFANGFTGRANSVNPLLSSSLPVEEKIAHCEREYAARGIGIRFRLTDAMQPAGLENVLEAHGYHDVFNETDVQVCDLQANPVQRSASFHGSTTLNPAWLEAYRSMNHVAEADAQTLYTMLTQIQTPIFCGWIRDQAVGLAVLDGQWVGLFDIVVAPQARRQGLGRELVSSLMAWGSEQGARYAYLQVTAANTPARALYAQLGYHSRYRYWYRRKPVASG